MAPRFSLVVPAYNEEVALPRLLDSVDAAREVYSGGADAIEVVVADNASTDSTAAIAASRGCRIAAVEKRVIAAARNGGAALARGEILAFVDADTRIHPRTFEALDRMLAGGRVVAGATGIRPERWSLGFAVTWALVVPAVVLLRMDTGVVCCRRADFLAVGGYDESLLFAEDVDFLLRMRRLGRPRGQRLGRARGAKAIASMRKFDQHGEWHYFKLLPRGAIALLTGRGVRDFAEGYWYRPKR
jgi:glycosyltransferase involved in cell wall biosynthesis